MVPIDRGFLAELARLDILDEVCQGHPTGNEENIKVKIVAPILELLGYDPIRDLDYERHVERGRPDIVVLVDAKPFLIVEAKGLDKDLSDYKAQGLGYARDAGIPWTILTNGVQWDLYKTFIQHVATEDNEPVLTLRSEELPTRFLELERYISKSRIAAIDSTADPEVKFIARKAKAADVVRILHGFRTSLLASLRQQFDKKYHKQPVFTKKVDRWISEQGVDTDYDWMKAYKKDKKFREHVITLLKQQGLTSGQPQFEARYRKPPDSEFSRLVDTHLRQGGIPVDWPDKLCFEGAYSFINRILFLRICEDSEFIDREITPNFIKRIRDARSNDVMITRLQNMFTEMRDRFPGIYRLPLLDHLSLPDLEWEKEIVADLCQATTRFDFRELGDVLGHLYERHVDYNTRRLIGQFYTHDEKVSFIIDQVRLWLVEGVKVLDPACGSGSFLLEAYRRLMPILVNRGYSVASAHGYLLQEVLHGVDVDSFAAQLTAINLLVRNLDEPVGSLQVYSGNSLKNDIGLSQFGFQIAGSPEGDFPDPRNGNGSVRTLEQVLVPSSFDVIVENPPFFRVGNEHPIYGPMIRSEHGDFAKVRPPGAEMNIATMFLKKSIDLLASRVDRPRGAGGICGIILPKSLTYVDEYRLIREYLLRRCKIRTIVDLGRGWEDVGLEHVILIFEKVREKPSGKSADFSDCPVQVIHDVQSLRRGIYKSHELRQKLFNKDPRRRFLLYIYGEGSRIHQKLHRVGKPLSTFKMVVWEGIRDDHKVPMKPSRESPRNVPLLSGAAVRRWYIEPEHYVPSRDPQIPFGIKVKCARPEKIVIKRVISSKVRIEAVIDRERSITHSSTTSLYFKDKTSLRYVVGILNSRLMNLYVRDWIYNRTELTMNFREDYLGEIPIPPKPRSAHRKRIEEAVEALEKLYRPPSDPREIRAEDPAGRGERLKEELDHAVYNLYGLTDEEIRFIEDSMPYSD